MFRKPALVIRRRESINNKILIRRPYDESLRIKVIPQTPLIGREIK